MVKGLSGKYIDCDYISEDTEDVVDEFLTENWDALDDELLLAIDELLDSQPYYSIRDSERHEATEMIRAKYKLGLYTKKQKQINKLGGVQ